MLKTVLDDYQRARRDFEAEEHHFRNQLPAALRQLRRQLRLSQTAFGDLLGISATYVSQLERGRAVPGLELVERCAELEGKNER